MLENELSWRTEPEVDDGLPKSRDVVKECVRVGNYTEGVLPGGCWCGAQAPPPARQLALGTDRTYPLRAGG